MFSAKFGLKSVLFILATEDFYADIDAFWDNGAVFIGGNCLLLIWCSDWGIVIFYFGTGL